MRELRIEHAGPHHDIPVIITEHNHEYNAIEFEEGGPTEEGFNYRTTRYWFDGEFFRMDIGVHSQDCDGPMDTESYYKWMTGDKRWEQISSVTHDYYAERMGY